MSGWRKNRLPGGTCLSATVTGAVVFALGLAPPTDAAPTRCGRALATQLVANGAVQQFLCARGSELGVVYERGSRATSWVIYRKTHNRWLRAAGRSLGAGTRVTLKRKVKRLEIIALRPPTKLLPVSPPPTFTLPRCAEAVSAESLSPAVATATCGSE